MSPLFYARASMEAKRIKSGQSNCPEKEEREITQDKIWKPTKVGGEWHSGGRDIETETEGKAAHRYAAHRR